MDLIVEFFPGLREMENFHPLLVHFPIAFLSGYFLLDLMAFLFISRSLTRFAGGLLWLGTLGAVAAAAAGLDAALTVAHPPEVHGILESHRYFGLNVVALALLLSLWRLLNRGRFSLPGRLLHLSLAAFMILNLLRGADLGGLMVYKYGVAVQAAGIEASGHHHGSVLDEFREWLHEWIPHSHEPGHAHHHH